MKKKRTLSPEHLAKLQAGRAAAAARQGATDNDPVPVANPATPNQPVVEQKVGVDNQPLETPISQPTTLNPFKDEPPVETISDSSELELLKQQIAEMKANMQFMASLQQQPQQGAMLGASGGVLGTRDRYIIDPANYPSPVDRLVKEKRLQRFAFKGGPIDDYDYELEYRVDSVRYQTIDGIWQREPKFELELNRVIRDEETSEPTNGRYTVCRLIMHEDPEAAVVIARENGVPVDETNQKTFLDEMRYLRFRDWVIEAFMPAKPAQPKQNMKEMSIGGKLVPYFEINSEASETIPFSQLKSKV